MYCPWVKGLQSGGKRRFAEYIFFSSFRGFRKCASYLSHLKKYIYRRDEKDRKGFSPTFLRKNPFNQ
jgi:hypothetical protein